MRGIGGFGQLVSLFSGGNVFLLTDWSELILVCGVFIGV